MIQVSTHSWFNGEIADLEAGAPSIASINFHLGTSVFDGMIAYWNRDHYYIHRGEQHLVRFQQGAAKMGLRIPWSIDRMLRGIESLLEREPKGTQYVRPIAYRRAPELWVTGSKDRTVDVSIFTVRVKRDIDDPISCHISPIERISSRAIPGQTKVSGAYVNSFNARHVAEMAGFQDAIMLDREGRLAEASAANVFLIQNNRLLTPSLNPDVFPGITRLVVMDVSNGIGIATQQSDLLPGDIRGVEGLFLCSTLMEIRAVNLLDAQVLATEESHTFKAIVQEFRALTHQ